MATTKKMTKADVRREFKQRWAERCRQVPAYKTDKPAMRQDFSFFIDELHREGQITDHVADTVTLEG